MRYNGEQVIFMWMLQVLLYGLLKGAREILKKKSLGRSSVLEVLFFYTLFGFLLVSPEIRNAGGVPAAQMGLIVLKSFVIFVAWICSFKAIKKMPISLYGVLDLSRVLFATLLATIVMREVLSTNQIIGLTLVCAGLLMLKGLPGKKKEESVRPLIVVMAFVSCLLNAFSGLLDKILMKDVTSGQLQFWYMLYLVLLYLVYIIVSKTKIRVKESLKNPWIWMLAILFIIADRALFMANAVPESKISVMTLIKQSGCLVTILGGKFIFGEKNICRKLVCAAVIVTGIVASVL